VCALHQLGQRLPTSLHRARRPARRYTNGKVNVFDGDHTGTRTGEVIRHGR